MMMMKERDEGKEEQNDERETRKEMRKGEDM